MTLLLQWFLILRGCGRIYTSIQTFAFDTDRMTMLVASLTDKPSAEMTGKHRTWSSTNVT